MNVMNSTVAFWREPRHFWITRAVIIFVVTRLILVSAAYVSAIAVPDPPSEGHWYLRPDNVVVDVWVRWDSGYYLDLARKGYWTPTDDYGPPLNFLPLYPLLIALVTPLVGDDLTAGLLISNLSLVGALMLLYRLAELEFHDHATASRTIFYATIFPTSFYFSALYTESTFLLLAVGCVYFARKQLWAWAALFGLMAAITRVTGIVLWGIVGLEWLRAHGWTFAAIRQRDAWRGLWQGIRHDGANLAVIGTIPLGLLSFMLFLWRNYDDPLIFVKAQKGWGREIHGPLSQLWNGLDDLIHSQWGTGDVYHPLLIDVAMVLIVLGLTVWVWRRLGTSYGLYSALSVLVPLSAGPNSFSRYAVIIFPLFMLFGWWGRKPWVNNVLIALCSVFLGIFLLLFVNWIFVA